jgi:hypothetical protein
MRRAGLAVKAGDTIPYIVCKSEELDDVFNVPRMPDDVRNGKAQIGMTLLSNNIMNKQN